MWVVVGLEDDGPHVGELRSIVARTLGEPAAELRAGDAETLWQSLTDLQESGAARLVFTSAALDPVAAVAALDPTTSFVHHAASGRLHVFVERSDAQPCVDRLEPHGFALIEAAGAEVAPAAPSPAATLDLRRRIRASLDPAGRYALGAAWERGVL